MAIVEQPLKYKKGGWYFVTFKGKKSGVFYAMACTQGYMETVLDFPDHQAWFEFGTDPLDACLKLEQKMGLPQH